MIALTNPQSKRIKDPGLIETESTEDRQMFTVFSVDLEEGHPVWHFSMGVRCWPEQVLLRLEQWGDVEDKWFDHCLKRDMPRPFDAEHDYVDREVHSLHVRSKMTREEQRYIVDEKYGAKTVEQMEDEIIDELLAKNPPQ